MKSGIKSAKIPIVVWACSSAGRAFGSHPRGRGFESLQVHHFFILNAFFICRCDGIGRRAGLKILIAVSPGETRKPLYIKAFDNRINRVFSKSPSKSPSDFRRLLFETVRKRIYAGVMELADVLDSKSSGGNTVRVRPPPPALSRKP